MGIWSNIIREHSNYNNYIVNNKDKLTDSKKSVTY